jgi:DNA-binding Lrp family transcriptional regulator
MAQQTRTTRDIWLRWLLKADTMTNSKPASNRAAGQPAARLDAIDRAMLDVLSADARVSVRVLAERLRISRANAYARLQRLTDGGVITGFAAVIDPHRAGLRTSAYVMITMEQTSWRSTLEQFRAIPYVEHVALVAGDVDALLLVRTPDNATLRDVVLERIQAVEGVRATRTWLIFQETGGAGS